MQISEEIAKLDQKAKAILFDRYGKLTPWQQTLVARTGLAKGAARNAEGRIGIAHGMRVFELHPEDELPLRIERPGIGQPEVLLRLYSPIEAGKLWEPNPRMPSSKPAPTPCGWMGYRAWRMNSRTASGSRARLR